MAAQFALAEACSGEYLRRRFAELASDHVAIVRRVELKYGKPATGTLYAHAHISDEDSQIFLSTVTARGRAIVQINVEIVMADGTVTMNAAFDWFVRKITSVSNNNE